MGIAFNLLFKRCDWIIGMDDLIGAAGCIDGAFITLHWSL
jgi:hypothetical protein